MPNNLLPINDFIVRDLLGEVAQAQEELRNWITTTDMEWISRDQVEETLDSIRQTLEAARVHQTRQALKKEVSSYVDP